MSKLLRQILGAKEPAYSLKTKALEVATGHGKTDLSLLSHVLSETRQAINELGLDPDDTTPEELHSALRIKATKDDQEIKKACHGDIEKLLEKLSKRLPATEIPTITHATLKKILKARPPKKVMSALGFRSTESLLKRAPLDQLLLGAFMLESISWHRFFAKSIRNLTTSDVTMAKPKAVLIDKRLLKKSRYHHLVSLQCAGLVGVPRLPDSKPGAFLMTSAIVSEGLFHVHVRGVLLKLNRFQEGFLKKIATYTYTTPDPVGDIGKVAVPWISCYTYIAGNKKYFEDVPEATVEPGDFLWSAPAEALTLISQRVNFWQNTDSLAFVSSSHTISLNVSDIAHDLTYLIPLSHSTRTAVVRHVTVDLMARYFAVSPQKDMMMKRIGF